MRKLVAALISLAFATACSPHYTEADVARMETQIKTEFEQKGFVVDEVKMIKDAERHMKGYVRIHKPGILLSNFSVTKDCTATMDADSGSSLWECK